MCLYINLSLILYGPGPVERILKTETIRFNIVSAIAGVIVAAMHFSCRKNSIWFKKNNGQVTDLVGVGSE